MKFLYWALGFSLLLLLVVLSFTKIAEPDTMQYLVNGKMLFAHGFGFDFCSFNYIPHSCIINYMHEWVFGVILYIIYLLGSWNGLVVFQVIMLFGIFLLIFLASRLFRYSFFSTSVFIFLAILIGMERFILRADIFGILFAIVFYTTLRFYLEKKVYEKKGFTKFLLLIMLFVTQVAWTNSHGSFFLAFVFLGIYVFQGIIVQLKNILLYKKVSFKDSYWLSLFLLSLLTLLASLINPFGMTSFLEGLQYSVVISPYIREWFSPFIQQDFYNLPIMVFRILLFLTGIILFLSYRRIRLTDLCILFVFLALGIRYERNLFLSAIVCAIILPYYLDQGLLLLSQRLPKRMKIERMLFIGKILTTILIMLLSLYFIREAITDRLYILDHSQLRFGIGLSENNLPVGAANFIEKNNLQGNMFNDYVLGTYLNWKFYPQRKTFIDGLTFSQKSIIDYHNVITGATDYNLLAKKYHITYFILNDWSSETQHLLQTLYKDKKWTLVYFDEIGCIFIANIPANQAIIHNYAVNFQTTSNYNPNTLPTFKNPADFPYGFITRGLFWENIGLLQQANYQFQKAAALGTVDSQAYLGLGVTYAKLGKLNLALQPLQKAAQLGPNFAPNHYNLGYYYFTTNRYHQALDEFKNTLAINSSYPGANFFIGIIYQQQADTADAKMYFQNEIDNNPDTSFAKNAKQALSSY